MRRYRGVYVLWLGTLLPAGCVEEHDTNRPEGAEAGAAAADSAERPPAPSGLVASLTEWNLALSQAQVAAGTVSFDVQNNGTEAHALVIEGAGQEWRSEPLEPGDAVTMSVVLPPGTYQVYCPIASGGEAHADRGMTTTLQVR